MVPFDSSAENMNSLLNVTSEDSGTESDNNGTSEDLWRENEAYARIIAPAMVYLAVVMVVGAIGNSLVVYVYSFRFRVATQHFLIVCLACSDLLMCLLAIPTEITDLRFHFTFTSDPACRLLKFVTMFCSITSNFVLIVIAVDRYRRICHPLRRQMSLREARWGAALSVLGSLLTSWPLLVMSGLRTAETQVKGLFGWDCSFSDEYKDTVYPLAFNAALGVGFVLMTIALAVLYFRIWRQVRRHKSCVRKMTVGSVRSLSISSVSYSDGNGVAMGTNTDSSATTSVSATITSSVYPVGHTRSETCSSRGRSLSSATDCSFVDDNASGITTLSENGSPVLDHSQRKKSSVRNPSVSTHREVPLADIAVTDTESHHFTNDFPRHNSQRRDSLASVSDSPHLTGRRSNENSRKKSQYQKRYSVQSENLSSSVSSLDRTVVMERKSEGRQPHDIHKKRQSRSSIRNVDKTTIVAFAVTLVFVISFLPYLALMFVRAMINDFDYTLHTSAQLNAYSIFISFYFLNSAANPIIYGVFNEKFRKECWTLCLRMCCCCLPKRLREKK